MSWPRILWSYETVSLPLQWLWWSCAVGRMRLKGLKRSASVSEKPTDLRRDMVMRCRAALQKPSNERWKPKIQRQAQLRSPLLHLEIFPQPSAISLESTCGWGLVEDRGPALQTPDLNLGFLLRKALVSMANTPQWANRKNTENLVCAVWNVLLPMRKELHVCSPT
ncbi:uncharacterized protein B0H64DRAFT_142764 [Chaetomium fimeti]|uniref:Uncharacterized protein n=1 Tax=Chaetomium fimeti TaxID=1854472 RepID=A0AAE0LRY1_9PEZI|nr:hypothetical protein B0H64DRAFT_142764 [Chaetomium fimeti]